MNASENIQRLKYNSKFASAQDDIGSALGRLHRDGVSRSNRYEVILYPPTGNRGTGSGATQNEFGQVMNQFLGDGTVRSTALKCESISFPGRNLDTTEDTNIYGPVRNIVTGFSFADISATFQCSADMREKIYFETWQRLSYNTRNFSMGYYYDYVGTVEIHALNEQNDPQYGVALVEAFPKSINEQALSYENGASYQTVTVNFAYRYWKNLVDETDYPKVIPNVTSRDSSLGATRQRELNFNSVQSRLGNDF